MAIYKVFYQENKFEIPVRENTQVKYIEAKDKPSVIKYLEEKEYNVEHIQELSGNYLEVEKESADYKLEKING